MTRRIRADEEAFGSDSFLDVVANVVGILIILVIVAGLRIQHLPSPAETEAVREAAAALAQAEASTGGLEREVLEVSGEIQRVVLTTAERQLERAALAQAVAARQRELDERRQASSADERAKIDRQRDLAAARGQLAGLERDLAEVADAKAPRIEVQAYPTPISQTVYGKEYHFQLRGGRAAAIPIDELIDRIKHQAQQKYYRLRDETEFTDTVGPVDGFRMRYTIERVDIPLETQIDTGRTGSYAQLALFTLIPTSNQLGEALPDALSERSAFRTALTGLVPRRTTVTLWTYPDSFTVFRELKKELHRLGFSVAGRPLEEGQPIGGSPQGSKSAAQ